MQQDRVSPRPFLAIRRFASAIAVGSVVLSSNAFAEDAPQARFTLAQLVEDDGSSERLALSGKLRMLRQRVVSAACYLQAGIETESSRETLVGATAEFEKITAALEFGDTDLGIPTAEERRRTLAGISKINELWAPMATLAAAIEAGNGSTDDVASLAVQSADLLDIAKRLVVQINSQYSGQTSILQSDALTLDIAGRQRMLSQRIAKNGCLVSMGINPEQSLMEMQGASENFDTTLMALRFGMQEAGVQPPPNAEIADGLNVVADNWSAMSPIVADLAAGKTVDSVTHGVMLQKRNQMTGNKNKVVGMFSEA